MTLLQTIIIAIVQGITELFPISSVAHNVFTPYVFHWNLNPEFLKMNFLPFVVMLHLGTALALLIFFRDDWMRIIRSIINSGKEVSLRLLLLLLVGTIPAALIGFVLEKHITNMFSNVTTAAIFLIINGLLLFFGEKMKKRGTKSINDLSYGQAAVVGLFQALALVPGFSRSGASMTAGFWMGLKHEESARFSMLLATPIIAGAGILEVPKLIKHSSHGLFVNSLIGGLFAGLFAYIAVTILMHWFKRKEINAMKPFAYYCWIVGALILLSHFI
ncbi:putative bacitracin resistance protein [Desulfosporosinus acidiphilus SJ4]|uniref:Undecaprenyl-diphosphatase n=1 Tax=Desulfosporosinus acidiphilus (strain DSM 22704 / JCM 16185 / SJ4) TaxID=646529 RepID=I4DB78_DESAJ|nr:undecaprenyl-diphosphate phosphatase [Desulfosporosinus acidiphilus]AFM43052.1 putative bacitracin resistance protein [Desulfosporosinus acidiphilus SJ4]